MKKTMVSLVLATMLTAAGVAAWAASNPPNVSQLPVVRYGEQAPSGQSFILLYPAGMALPVQASVTGSLFASTDSATLNATLKQDIYVYQHWISFDGKTWQNAEQVMQNKMVFQLPGERDGKSAGTLSAEFNLK